MGDNPALGASVIGQKNMLANSGSYLGRALHICSIAVVLSVIEMH